MSEKYPNFPKEKWLQDIYLYAYHYTYAYIKAIFALKHLAGTDNDHDQQSHASGGSSVSIGVTGFWKGKLENNDLKSIEDFAKANGFKGKIDVIEDVINSDGSRLLGSYNPETGNIKLTKTSLAISIKELSETLIHELMHAKINSAPSDTLFYSVKNEKSVYGISFRFGNYSIAKDKNFSEYAAWHWENSPSKLAFEETICELALLDYSNDANYYKSTSKTREVYGEIQRRIGE